MYDIIIMQCMREAGIVGIINLIYLPSEKKNLFDECLQINPAQGHYSYPAPLGSLVLDINLALYIACIINIFWRASSWNICFSNLSILAIYVWPICLISLIISSNSTSSSSFLPAAPPPPSTPPPTIPISLASSTNSFCAPSCSNNSPFSSLSHSLQSAWNFRITPNGIALPYFAKIAVLCAAARVV
ncbi:hypothetical protein EV426DRAFT_607175 [Tirmania nivea]|nr:hypothetical protein EV426DRAFT_607175 [Tirmania nivea]